MKTTKRTLFVYSAMGLSAFALTGCMGVNNDASTSLASTDGGSLPGAGGTTQGPPANVQISAVKQTLNLAASATIPVTITSSNGYSGPVSLSLDKKVLTANDPNSQVSASISPSTVTVAPGSPASASVTVTSLVGAPDMNSFVNVVATTGSQSATGAAPFQIMAVYEVDLDSPPGAIETWSLAAKSTTKFTQHVGGLTLLFKNKDTTSPGAGNSAHRIHSSGTAFVHEGDGTTGKGEGLGLPGTTTPVTVDNPPTNKEPAQTAGDTYTAVVTSQVAQLSDTFYCHQHEDAGTAGRTMIFNAFSAPPVIGNSGNPNASYAYIVSNIITPQCASCHNPAMKSPVDGNIDLSTYASVFAQTLPGSAVSSALYAAVTSGGMPYDASGNPGTPLTSVQLQAISDWINDGAKNN